MTGPSAPSHDHQALQARIRELEARLEESEDTLEAMRKGDFDALVVQGPDNSRQVYTLQNADRPYRVLIEQIREGALTINAEGTVLYCNQRLAEMLEVRHERLIGGSLHDFIVEPDRAVLTDLLAEAGTGGGRGEVTLLSQTGQHVPAFVSLSELERDDSTPILCGVITDQTEQRHHLRELAQANARLEAESADRSRAEDALRQAQKMEAVGQLTGGIAHDFNNLLTIIKSSTDLLRKPNLTEDRRRRYVDAIAETADRAARLTNQLLAFARRQSLQPEVFEVGARVRQIVEMFASIVGPRIRIEQDIQSEACYVEADISQFETALVNLAVNARDAMNDEGSLTLGVAAARSAPRSLGGEAVGAGDVVVISVEDTGCGIAPDRISRIFEPFFTTKEVGKGTGLGLSQVFGFATQSGGTVDVESKIGHGTTFRIYLPAAEALDAPKPNASHRSEPAIVSGRGRRVLVVEDNVEVGRFSTQLLEDLGYETTWAASAAEALEELGTGADDFDVVFSDVVMPGMNGIELGREIQRRFPDLPIVLTSGYSQALAEESHHGFELLRKPYSVEQLSRILRKAFGAPQAKARSR